MLEYILVEFPEVDFSDAVDALETLTFFYEIPLGAILSGALMSFKIQVLQ